jgi:hypothetical protein
VGSIGNPTSAHVEHARRILEDIPAEVRSAAGNAAGAKAAVLALLLGTGETRARQLALVGEDSGPGAAEQCARLAGVLAPPGPRLRLPVLALAVPTLKVLPQDERDRLLRLVLRLIQAHGKVSLGEFVLQTMLRRDLGAPAKRAPMAKYAEISSVAAEAAVILSLLAHAGGGGMAEFRAPAELRFDAVESALNELKLLAPLKKPALIKACVAVVMADDRLSLAEGELVRAICAALDSPVPPVLETSEALE